MGRTKSQDARGTEQMNLLEFTKTATKEELIFMSYLLLIARKEVLKKIKAKERGEK